MAGVTADSGELTAAASGIRGAADPLRDQHSKKIAEHGVGEADFGKVHGQAASGFQDALGKLSKCVASMADAMDDFAGKIQDAGGGYDSTESDAKSDLNQAGGH